MWVYVIDHHDSFTFNLIDWLLSASKISVVQRLVWDDVTILERIKAFKAPIVFSPGPRSPEDYPATLSVMASMLGQVPLLGICLGHQMLAHNAGFEIAELGDAWHGSVTTIEVLVANGLFAGVPSRVSVASYNSLAAQSQNREFADWRVSAVDGKGRIQALEYTSIGAPALGLQFHPESFLSDGVDKILENWTTAASSWMG